MSANSRAIPRGPLEFPINTAATLTALEPIGTIHLGGMRATGYYLARRAESVLVKARERKTEAASSA